MRSPALLCAFLVSLIFAAHLISAPSSVAAVPRHGGDAADVCTPGRAASTMSLDLPAGFVMGDTGGLRLALSLFNASSTPLTDGEITVAIARHRTTTRADLSPETPARSTKDVAKQPIDGEIAADSRRDLSVVVSAQDLATMWNPRLPGPYRVEVTAAFKNQTLHAMTYLLWWPDDAPAVEPTPFLALAPLTSDFPNLLSGTATLDHSVVSSVRPLLTMPGVTPLVDGALTMSSELAEATSGSEPSPTTSTTMATPDALDPEPLAPEVSSETAVFARELLRQPNAGLLPWLNADPETYVQLTGDPAAFARTFPSAGEGNATSVMSFESVPSNTDWLAVVDTDPDVTVMPFDAIRPDKGTAGQAASIWHLGEKASATVSPTDDDATAEDEDDAHTVLTPNAALSVTADLAATAQHGICPENPLQGVTSFDTATARVAAELAVITLEQPNNPRAQVLRLPNTWAADANGYQRLVEGVLALPWVTPTDLQRLLDTPDIGTATLSDDLPAASTRNREQLRSAESSLETLRVIDRVLATKREGIGWKRTAAVASKAWDGRTTQWHSSLNELQQVASARRAAIRIDIGAQINVVAEQVELPVTVYNGLNEPVEVEILTDSDTPRLRTDDPVVVTIPPTSSEQVKLDLVALSDGTAELTAQVRSTDGAIVTEATGIEVRIRRMWESSAIVSGSIILSLFVVLGVARGILRDRRHRKAE